MLASGFPDMFLTLSPDYTASYTWKQFYSVPYYDLQCAIQFLMEDVVGPIISF